MNLVKSVITVADNKNNRSKLSMWSDLDGGWGAYTGFPLLDYISYTQGIVSQMDLVITGQIVRASLTFNIALPGGIKTVPGAFSDVNEIATAYSRRGNVRWSFPTFNHALFPVGAAAYLPDPVLNEDEWELMTRMLDPTNSSAPIDVGPGLSDNRGSFDIGLWKSLKKGFRK